MQHMKIQLIFLLGLICILTIVQGSANEASSETDSQTKLPQGLIRGDWTNKDSPYMRVDVDKAETASVTDVSMSFWARFSTKDPKTILLKDFKNFKWFIGGATEGSDWTTADQPKNCLLHMSWQNTNQNYWAVQSTFSSYTLKSGRTTIVQLSTDGNLDSYWIFYYLGKDRGAFIFTLGSSVSGNFGFPGYFFDARFDYKNAIIADRASAYNYLKKSVKLPPQMNPDTTYVQLVGDQELVSKETDQFAEVPQTFKKFYKFYGAEEWGVQGWFKFDGGFKSNVRYHLIRIVGNEPGELANEANEGDQLAYIFMINGGIYFQYIQTHTSYSKIQQLSQGFSQAQLNKWFWIYAGYSSLSRKFSCYVRVDDFEFRSWLSDSWMNIQKYHGIYIARDPFVGSSWNGAIRNVYFRVGRGAYRFDNFNDNFVNMKDMNCATLYSECSYTGNSHQICSTQNSFDPNFSVQSIQIPPGKKIKLFKQASLQGASVEFLSSQECLSSIDFSGNQLLLQESGIRLLEEHETVHMRDNNYQVHMQNRESNTLSSPPEDNEEVQPIVQRKLTKQGAL